jgi:DNA polymerase III subunit epsilon
MVKRWRSYAYVKLAHRDAFPRLAVARVPRSDGGLYLGPVPSAGTARLVIEAIETVVPLRRCQRVDPCTYRRLVDAVVRGLTVEPLALLEPLGAHMAALVAAGRFEEAAAVRDRAGALVTALHRQRRVDALRHAGVVRLQVPGGGAELRDGLLARSWGDDGEAALDPGYDAGPHPAPLDGPLPGHIADEVGCVASWLDANAASVRLLHCDGGLAWPLTPLPSFAPSERRVVSGHA